MAKILIVDDSAFARNSLKIIVESGGHKVVGRCGDGERALEMFKSLQPELVTLDSLMPNKSGEAVLEDIIRHDSGARVIMVSGSGDHEIKQRVLQAGAKKYVQKLHLRRDLLKAIKQAMEI